jgi:D-lactate dehydrogenase (cytochrome)
MRKITVAYIINNLITQHGLMINVLQTQQREESVMYMLTVEQQQQLMKIVGKDRFTTGISSLELHIHDISPHTGVLPCAILWPVSTAEVAEILKWADLSDIPVTPWGAGTSTEGNPVPAAGGIVVNMTRMNTILDIREDDLQVDVQPGVFRKELNRKLAPGGLFFPVDPGADATIGGMIANNASGVRTVKYGATRDYVMMMTIVLPGGTIIRTGSRAHKSSSGYDLTRLFVGSEGTLGIVTQATLRLSGVPSSYLAATVVFNDLESASEAVALIIASGLEPAALELLTEELIQLMNRENSLGLIEKPSLFCEFHGISDAALGETAELVKELCEDCGAIEFQHGMESAQRKKLWEARHDAWETIHRAHPGKETLIVDAAIPISKYPEMVLFSKQAVSEQGVPGYVFGHAGDGNLHVVLVGDPKDRAEWSKLETINERIVKQAIALDGTCTGEHGIGIGKRKFMALEHGASYDVMKQIKQLLDPKNLMNPGKIFI